jgi:pyridoxal phosphate enzyme (YggS family)
VLTNQRDREINRRYQGVLERIEAAASRACRSPADVRLMVVTKTHPVETIQAVLQAGVLHLGENYAEEAVSKKLALAGPPGVTWHMIGHVQSRKAALVVEHLDWVHSLDSLKLANRLNRFAAAKGRRVPVLLECNVSGEESKFGWPTWKEAEWEMLLEPFTQVLELAALQVRGLMTMAPFLPDSEEARPYFQRLKRLQGFLSRNLPDADWTQLSMGMSADFEIAIEEGATWVRIGTAITGSRS